MTDTVTTNMGLTEPGVLQSPGPDYATLINADMGIIDEHDHSSGKGVQVPTAGLNINDDLDINGNNLNAARSYRMQNNGANLSGPDDINDIYVFAGDLWYNNSAGVPVQITNAGTISSGTNVMIPTLVSGSTSIGPTDIFNYYEVDITSADFTIGLPAVSAVTPGTFYFFTDIEGVAGNPHTVTITAQPGDTINTLDLSIDLIVPFESILLVSDGFSTWMASYFATKSLVEGRLGTDRQNVIVKGLSATVQATGTGITFIGAPTNTVQINGTEIDMGHGATATLVAVDGHVTTTGAATVGGVLTASSTTHLVGATTLDSTLHCIGAATLDSTLHTIGNTTHDGLLTVGGITTLNGSTFLNANTTITANLDVNGNAIVRDTFQIAGAGASFACTAPTVINASSVLITSASGNTITFTNTPEILLAGIVKLQTSTKIPYRLLQVTISTATMQLLPLDIDYYRLDGQLVNRDVWMVTTSTATGTWLYVENIGSTNNIVVHSATSGGTLIATLTPGQRGFFMFDGVAWFKSFSF